MQFHRPQTVRAALDVLAGEPVKILAGGTDFFPAQAGRTRQEPVLDLSRIDALRGIAWQDDVWRFGAMTTWTDIRTADLPSCFSALQLAAAEVGSVQIQNAGTIAGNLCNASPAADGVPPLLALDASVEIAGPLGVRVLPLASFLQGVRKTALEPGEFVTAVLVPGRPWERAAFRKLGARRYLVISIAMVAANVACGSDGTLSRVSVAVGACSAVAQRLRGLENALLGLVPGSDAFAKVIEETGLPEIKPIDDVRATADYRLDAVRTLIARAITAAAEGRD